MIIFVFSICRENWTKNVFLIHVGGEEVDPSRIRKKCKFRNERLAIIVRAVSLTASENSPQKDCLVPPLGETSLAPPYRSGLPILPYNLWTHVVVGVASPDFLPFDTHETFG